MNSLIGLWLFTSLFYQGQLLPPPNENLKIYYSFLNQYRNEIYYYRANESGFCRRWANYQIDGTFITQTIDQIDDENTASCSADTDMQIGNTSKVHYEIINAQLHLYLPLGEEEIHYIFDQIDK